MVVNQIVHKWMFDRFFPPQKKCLIDEKRVKMIRNVGFFNELLVVACVSSGNKKFAPKLIASRGAVCV